MMPDLSQLRFLPSVDELIQSDEGLSFISSFSRSATLRAIRTVLDQARTAIRSGASCPSSADLLCSCAALLSAQFRPSLRPLINATGVIIHTNLGRAPLSLASLEAVRVSASQFSNLEYNLDAGERGSRHVHVAALLRDLTGAAAARVTNNNAAAVLLTLSTLATGREVVISRGQLVEIGGGFRVPDVIRQSGCELVEVGTTNRTRITDYEQAITPRTAALLRVHPSNFLITGFTESTSPRKMAALAHEHNLPLVDDLGSGCLLLTERYGLTHEPLPQESLTAGADIVCFSGDKLLGGPQAGIIVGRAELVARIAKHPLMRALRIDKMTLAALEATLLHYKREEAERQIPVWQMISAQPQDLARRARAWVTALQEQKIPALMQSGTSTIGGGSLPGETLPTTLLALPGQQLPCSLEELSRRLRKREHPVITRMLKDHMLLDPRTVFEDQDSEVVQALVEAMS